MYVQEKPTTVAIARVKRMRRVQTVEACVCELVAAVAGYSGLVRQALPVTRATVAPKDRLG
jgi:hypothetical protein